MRKMVLKITSLSLIMLSLSMVMAWIFKWNLLVLISPNHVPILFNSALCFLFLGIALYLGQRQTLASSQVQIVLASIVAVIAALSLIETIFNINIGIDTLFFQSWYSYLSTNPNRIAPNTAFTFLCAGLVFMLFPLARRAYVAISVEMLIFTVFVIGLLSACGYFFNVEFLYSWHSYAYMSFFSSICFILLAIGLWVQWWSSPYSLAWYTGHEDKKILFVSSLILLTIALLSGLSGFISAIKQQDEYMGVTFQQILKDKVGFLQGDILRGSIELDSLRNNIVFQQLIAERKAVDLKSVDSELKLFLAEGFSAIEIYDVHGTLIAKKGNFISKPELSVQLESPGHPLMKWKNGWFLELLAPIDENDKSKGYLRAERPMNAFNHLALNELSMTKTAEFLICAPVNQYYANCFPTKGFSKVFEVPRALGMQLLPIDYALRGKSGIIRTYDFQRNQVLAAYTPLGVTGLGIVLQMNLSEIYSSVFKSLTIILPLIAVAILIGILFLRLAVLPLLRKVINAENELLKSNKMLLESQERYDLAVVGSRVGLWDWQIEKDFIFYSPIFKEMMGAKGNELGTTVSEFMEYIHPDDYERIKKAIETHLKDHVPFNVEYRLKSLSGEYFWAQAIGQALWDGEGHPKRMAGSIFDISDRKKIQRHQATVYAITEIMSEALQFDESIPKILRAICEGLNWDYGGLWMVEPDANLIRNVSMWSRPTLKLDVFKNITKKMFNKMGVGLPGIVWQTAKPHTVFNAEDKNQYLRTEEAKLAGLHTAFGFPILLGYRVLGVVEFFSSENKVPSDEVLRMMAAIGPQIGQFILRKSIENDLRESEAYKTAIVEFASDSIITMDDYGVVVSCNAQTEKLFGYTVADLRLKNINELMPGLFKRIKQKSDNVALETTAIRHDGDQLTVEISVSEVTINNAHRYVGIIRNVTERKKMEALKSEFISIVSHELRTPLTSIRGAIGLMIGGAVGGFSEKANQMLEIASNNCCRLLLLINDILDLEKIEAGKMMFDLKNIDITALVTEAITANQSYADKFSVKLKLTQSVPGVLVNVDPDRLMQVLTNLISNAVKFSPAEAQVSIEIELHKSIVRINVKDNGPGIPGEFKSRIFQKFSQADSSSTRGKGGTGLGLSISSAIIEKLKGNLNFTSEFGEGSNFYIELPLADIDQSMLEHISEHAQLISGSTVLICEDDSEQAEYLSYLLQSAGFNVDTALDARTAKKRLAEKQYNVLLLDLLLPGEDGIAFIRELRSVEATKDLPIIVISVICESGKAMLQGDAVSIVDWLDKPVDFTKLIHIIKSIKMPHEHGIPRILHVEDDKDVRVIVEEILKDVANVTTADTIRTAKEKLTTMNFDLVILDLMLPDGNGTELLQLLSKKHLPVVVFSSSELDQNFSKYVSQTLLKSKTTNQKLLNMIKQLLAHANA